MVHCNVTTLLEITIQNITGVGIHIDQRQKVKEKFRMYDYTNILLEKLPHIQQNQHLKAHYSPLVMMLRAYQ